LWKAELMGLMSVSRWLRRQMANTNEAGATRPCPHCRQPVQLQCEICPHCHEVIQVVAEKTSPPKEQVAVKARAQPAPTDVSGHPEAAHAELEEDDWNDRVLASYD